MESQIGWIDFSPKDRNRVKRFMDIMGMGGVVDELGIPISYRCNVSCCPIDYKISVVADCR